MSNDLGTNATDTAEHPRRRQRMSLRRLKSLGFEEVGSWSKGKKGKVDLKLSVSKKPGIYPFVIKSKVYYVGVSTNNIPGRLGQYKNNINRPVLKASALENIKKSLNDGNKIKLFAKVTKPYPISWVDGIPFSDLYGIEAGFFELIDPAWNTFGQVGRDKRANAKSKK